MSLQEIKLYAINGSALGVTTFTQIEDWLKIILLIVTIGYTISKWSKVPAFISFDEPSCCVSFDDNSESTLV